MKRRNIFSDRNAAAYIQVPTRSTFSGRDGLKQIRNQKSSPAGPPGPGRRPAGTPSSIPYAHPILPAKREPLVEVFGFRIARSRSPARRDFRVRQKPCVVRVSVTTPDQIVHGTTNPFWVEGDVPQIPVVLPVDFRHVANPMDDAEIIQQAEAVASQAFPLFLCFLGLALLEQFREPLQVVACDAGPYIAVAIDPSLENAFSTNALAAW